ncbi:MAG TPA: hypothetical protein VGL56_15925 [Fimbriimonadaceae bacterium]
MKTWLGRILAFGALGAAASCAAADNGFEGLKLSFEGQEFSLQQIRATSTKSKSLSGTFGGDPFVVLSAARKSALLSARYVGNDVSEMREIFSDNASRPFPSFSIVNLPPNIHCFSFKERNFSPPSFSLNETATPCLFFNDKGQAFIFSPASNFMISRLTGDGKTSVGLAFNPQVQKIAAGTSQDALLVFAPTIHEAWQKWGAALRKLYHRDPVKDDQDILLKKFGYWTDNGADYYYNYNLDRGYANTLLDLRQRYQDEGIPLGYMQLDSWWYEKSTTDATGKFSGAIKNSKLPPGMWNRYGGLMEYKADPFLFSNGLEAFDKELGLPLATHNRWMDVNSPYRGRFKVSGVAAIDLGFWNEIASYLSNSGVKCYEQDWLDRIYDNSPEMATDESIGNAFTGGMAKACGNKGLTMQYCMATPRFMLNGVKYPNLTTIRTSDDRFGPDRWRDFLYVSELADGIGARPWCDVYMSSETPNMILDVLSGGPVGTGDRIGNEDKANIMKAVRPDGVIVKPDTPLLPTDRTFINEVNKVDAPFVARTSTHGGVLYYFAFMHGGNNNEATLDMVAGRRYYLCDLLSGEGRYVDSRGPVPVRVGRDGYGYWMACLVNQGGVTILGDLDQFVPQSRERVEQLTDFHPITQPGPHYSVYFAKGESAVQISGVSDHRPTVKSDNGEAELTSYLEPTERFVITVSPKPGMTQANLTIK